MVDTMKAIFLDIETDGLDPDIHLALEIAVVGVDLHNMSCMFEYSSFIHCSENHWDMHSDPEALKYNGITFNDVKDAKRPHQVSGDLVELFLSYELDKTNSIFICQNPSFDRAFFPQIMSHETQRELDLPYHWLDLASMYWAKSVNPKKPVNGHNSPRTVPMSKDAIAKYLGLPSEEKPHKALNGVKHLIDCYKAIFELE